MIPLVYIPSNTEDRMNEAKQRREALGITQDALARLCHVSRTMISSWERRSDGPLPAVIDEALEALELARKRERHGIRQDDLAKAIGVTQTTLSRWETLQRKPVNSMAWRAWRETLAELSGAGVVAR